MFDIIQIKKVDIIVIQPSTLEANAIRAVLESWMIQVRVHYIGNVKHFISLFKDSDYLHKIIIISCHGDAGGIIIPELDYSIEKDMPYHKRLNSDDLLQIINLNEHIIINTGCCMGKREYSNAFLNKNSSTYIGTDDYVESNATVLFVLNLLYFLLVKEISLESAFEKACNIDEETKHFKLWKKNEN